MPLPPPRSTLFPYTTLFRSSESTNLVPGDTNGASDVFVRDRTAGTTERISVSTGGAQGDSGSGWARLSANGGRSEEHTSELQSHSDLVCRLLLEKKKEKQKK